jgi:hypothetical protein
VRSGRTAEDEWRASGVRGDAEPGRAWAAVSGVRGLAGPCAGGGGWDRPGRARAAVAADRDLGCENNKVLTGRGGHDIFAGGKNNIDIFGGKKSSNITLVLTVTSKTVKIISNRQKNTLFRVVGR